MNELNYPNLPKRVEEGVMLHCHTWPFKLIEQNLDEIASAGFNSIQVSPIQKIRKPFPSEINPLPTGPWYLLYQPVSFKRIGNYKLGAQTKFKSLCIAAHERGIKIIVDVVLNHIADTGIHVEKEEQLDKELQDRDLYHNIGTITDYNIGREITQGMLYTLPDLMTQNQIVQDMHANFLNKCIDLGADGFRFDAAKHIETDSYEDSGKDYSGDYWTDVISQLKDRDKLYLVGEVLHGGYNNVEAYMEHFDITASSFAQKLRDAFSRKDLWNIGEDWETLNGLPKAKSLAYIENHDDYEHRQVPYLDKYEDRIAANVYLIARNGFATRVLDRYEDDIWNDPRIKAINHFHNAVIGLEENHTVLSQTTVKIERGKKAIVIINIGKDDFYFNESNDKTNLKDGTYIDNNFYKKKYPEITIEVKDNRLIGRIPSKSIFISNQT